MYALDLDYPGAWLYACSHYSLSYISRLGNDMTGKDIHVISGHMYIRRPGSCRSVIDIMIRVNFTVQCRPVPQWRPELNKGFYWYANFDGDRRVTTTGDVLANEASPYCNYWDILCHEPCAF